MFIYVFFSILHFKNYLHENSALFWMFAVVVFQVRQQPVQTVSQIVKINLKGITNPVWDVTCMWIAKVTDTQRKIYRVVKKVDYRNIGTQQKGNVP